MIFIERYPLKRCQGCVKLIASKVKCFLNINDLSEVQLCMSSNSWTWECPHTKDGADHVPLIFLSSVFIQYINIDCYGTSGTVKLASLPWRNYGPAPLPQPRSVPPGSPIQNLEKLGPHLRLQDTKCSSVDIPPPRKVVHPLVSPWKFDPSYVTHCSRVAQIMDSVYVYTKRWKSNLGLIVL